MILEKLIETNLEQTVGYGEDPYCEHARELIRKAAQAPEADVHFLVGGTQTNFTVISAYVPIREYCRPARDTSMSMRREQ